ncbi:MAG: urate hydroxylase PuuD [Deltaproteobacteria bacterium]|nr:urate hydroxylase PuuD [Deltaproteobacteria bacterium]MCW5807655.1 urate hydroxylase PuuD [Deltaproteobacteria bacterium]
MHGNELLDVIFRWAHLIAGIMWVGNSMLFNWLDRNLEKKLRGQDLSRLSQGKIFMVHSGAFYDVEKKLLEPGEMPDTMHWFKWQNGITWLTGIALLVVVYYMNGAAFLVDPRVADIDPKVAIALSATALLTAWIVYDGMWRLWGESNPRKATIASIVLLFGSVFAFAQVFSGRGAYIQVGVLMGTLMTGNVWMCIVPSQRELIAATTSGRDQDPTLSIRAKQRSIHNNYMTFPLLFVMLSNHFGGATSHHLNWLILILVMIGGAGIRHFMNIRYRGEGKQLPTFAWLAPAIASAAIAVAGLMVVSRIEAKPRVRVDYEVKWARAQEIIGARCVRCHSAHPADDVYRSPPNNVMFDTPQQIETMAARIKVRAVDLETMPLNNQTQMTDVERAELDAWLRAGAPIK